jgi:hypothetical protein
MMSLKFGLVAAAMISALSVSALATPAQAADCKRIAALGSTVTHDTSVLFANNALKNTLASKGLVGKGPVKMTCEAEGAMTTCRASQTACTGGTAKTCLGAWLCF